ncbi:hypothetical protein BH11PLA2_BH11PLA2_13670 [soil metagenome]
MAIEFWCVECGQKHTAERVEAGHEIVCTRCRMMIRVPPQMFAAVDFESTAGSNTTNRVMFEQQHVDKVLLAIRLLEFSLVLFGCAIAAISMALIFALDHDGLDSLITWSWKLSASIIATGFVITLALLLLGMLFRGIAYSQFRPIDRFLGGDSVLLAAQCGLGLQALAGILLYGLTTSTAPSYALFFSVVLCGVSGLAIEFTELLALRRLLVLTGGPRFNEGIRNYIILFLSTLFGGLTFIVLPGVVLKAYYGPTLRDPASLALILAVMALAVLACLILMVYPWHRLLMATRQQMQRSSFETLKS